MSAEAPSTPAPVVTEFVPGVRANLRYDVPAGLVVFLVALPLCLGIALASEAPLISGIITGVIAGLLVSILSGSELSVSGPAAGLTVIVASGIHTLGSFEAILTATLVAGAWQVVFGLLRAGVFAGFFPTSVIKGMLAGIGLIIILKQIPHALGRDNDFEGDLGFFEFAGKGNTFSEIIVALRTWSGGAVIITVLSFAALILWARPEVQRFKLASFVPAQLVAVFVGLFANETLAVLSPGMEMRVENNHLVELPIFTSLGDLWTQLRFPDFSKLTNTGVHTMAITLAVVASLETLLCVEATDKLDPIRRISSKSRELIAQGIGNMACALVGGIPMTSVIVRSSANIYAGARTRTSAFVHGLLMLAAVATVPWLLNRIPLACLAAILILVGYKLATVKLFKQMFQEGAIQWVPFATTIIAIVFSDLLKGVLIGLGVGLFMVLKSNIYSAINTASEGKDFLILFTKDVSFINNIRLKRELAKIPDGASVWIDGSRAMFIDHDIQELVGEFQRTAHLRGIHVEVKDIEGKQYPLKQRTRIS